MTIDSVFYGVYLSQILLLSAYVPRIALRRARSLIAMYPPSGFPKLYPVPVVTIERALHLYSRLNLALLILGLALLATAWVYGYSFDLRWQFSDMPTKHPVLPAIGYTVLQMAPLGLFGCWEWRYFKLMRVAARNRIRTAELKARRLLDFVSPALLGTAVVMYIGAAASLLLLGNPFVRAYQFLVLTICNVGLAGLMVVHGWRLDPHQTHDDRSRIIRAGWRNLVVASILLSALAAIQSVLIAFKLLHYVPLVVSLSVQVVGILSTRKFCMVVSFGQKNFDVYRGDPAGARMLATNE